MNKETFYKKFLIFSILYNSLFEVFTLPKSMKHEVQNEK